MDQFIGAVQRLSASLQFDYGLPNCAEAIISALAVIRCEGVVSPVDPTYTISILKDNNMKCAYKTCFKWA